MKKVLFSLAIFMIVIAISSAVILAIQTERTDNPLYKGVIETKSYTDSQPRAAGLLFVGMSDADDILFRSHILNQCKT